MHSQLRIDGHVSKWISCSELSAHSLVPYICTRCVVCFLVMIIIPKRKEREKKSLKKVKLANVIYANGFRWEERKKVPASAECRSACTHISPKTHFLLSTSSNSTWSLKMDFYCECVSWKFYNMGRCEGWTLKLNFTKKNHFEKNRLTFNVISRA